MNTTQLAQRQMLRDRMVAELKGYGIKNPAVLETMAAIPREMFIAPALSAEAYDNKALPIGENQTISQPAVVAWMSEALNINKTHKVLEVGTGSGYQTAILCKLAKRVFSIERFDSLAHEAERRLQALRLTNFVTRVGDGSLGWPEQQPFDRIMVTAAAPKIPQALVDQLAPDGIMVIPVGPTQGNTQKLVKITFDPQGQLVKQILGSVHFVPLVGKQGLNPPKKITAR